ncbi:MAG TPA: hypothetical protein VM123_07675 [archaeon]|nr:hypothetical protein [archaeon]
MASLFKVRFFNSAVFVLIVFLGHTRLQAALEVPVYVSDAEGYARRSEPVTLGISLPRGVVTDLSRLSVAGPDRVPVPAQFEPLATWPDGSVKWVLLDMLADCPSRGTNQYLLRDTGEQPDRRPVLKLTESGDKVVVETGVLRCILDRKRFDLFDTVYLDHDQDGSFSESERVTPLEGVPGVSLVNQHGREINSRGGNTGSFEVEARGPVRATVAVKGSLADPDGESFLDYTARLSFYAGNGLVRIFFTLENHRYTVPLPGSHWVLGRPGNMLFEDMSLAARVDFDGPIQMSVGDGPEDILDRVVLTGKGGIYQESSGGENWFHRNHMNYLGRIPLRFRGARVFIDGVEPYSRHRPDAWLHVADRRFGLAVAVRHFWQNFPKGLTAEPDGTVRVALWPEEFPDLHELQGGEIKTHEIAFFFHTGPQGSTRTENRVASVMGSFHHPLYARAPAEWYLASGFFDDATIYDPQRFPAYERYMQGAVAAKGNNLTADIEKIDEYGWRNFGDTWAKNETDKTGGPHTGRQVVSHFNLEYDFGYGMLFQSLRTIDGTPELSRKWWSLAEAALRHESDIDLYHCKTDPRAGGVYNSGKFTHTQHGVEAALVTHRGGPRLTWFGSLRWPWGQGSSPESGHFNNRGQMCYYYLTGNRRVLESALEHAGLVYWKIAGDKFAQIDQLSREAGNNLQIMTDAYLFTWDEKYREAAEKILKSTAPEKQWYMTAEGRSGNPEQKVEGFWTSALCINAAARWTAVMEEKTGKPYQMGRTYITAYADFVSRFLAGGPEVGFYSSWSPAGGGRGAGYGPWTFRIADLVMFGHKYTADLALKKRCLKAAADAFQYMGRRFPGSDPVYTTGKNSTMHIGGGHEYTFFKRCGQWPE